MITIKKTVMQVLLAMVMLIGITSMASAQDAIEGVWFNDKKDAKIQIYKGNDGKFYGKIIWIKEPTNADGSTKTDTKNSKDALKSRPIVGLVILKGAEKDGTNSYDDGTIYDPENGKTYDCTIKNKGNNTLALRGYIGISLFGRTTEWSRTN